MDVSFWLTLALSFFVSSLWVTLTTIFAERFGSKYEIMVRYLYPTFGLVPGTAIARSLSLGTSYLTCRFMKARLS